MHVYNKFTYSQPVCLYGKLNIINVDVNEAKGISKVRCHFAVSAHSHSSTSNVG